MKVFFRVVIFGFGIFAAGASVSAAETIETEDGTTNPEELTFRYHLKHTKQLKHKHTSIYVCAMGSEFQKAGMHKEALEVFEYCSKKVKNPAAMIMFSHAIDNGYGTKKDPKRSAEWEKRSSDTGYSVGQFNYGLSLLQGRGVKRDVKAGKALINRAAKQGDTTAKELIESGYDIDVVTPDAQQLDKKPAF